MSRYSTTKRTMTIAALIILLCFAAIVGSTLAIFTARDDGTIGVNATAGDLKVDIVDDTDDPQSLVGQVLKLQKDPEAEDPDILFEPGSTIHTQGFRIENEGDIDINYIIYLSNDEDAPEGFFDAFDVFITNDVSDRGSLTPIYDFGPTLKAKELSEVYYLVFRMKSSTDNDWNREIPAFEAVGITVCAFQGNVDIE